MLPNSEYVPSQKRNTQNYSNQVLPLGRTHLVLNKTLMDETSIKWAQIKTFIYLIQFC